MENTTLFPVETLANISLANGNRSDENLTSTFTEEEWLALTGILPWLVGFFFGAIAITGFVGNLLVILVVVFNNNMRSTTNLMIVNLAAADLLFVILCIPFTAADYVTDYWPFGRFWCRSVQYLIVVTAFASIYTLVLMSIDRFLAVVHPIRSRMMRTENITMVAIVTLWAVVLVVSAPVFLINDFVVSGWSWEVVGTPIPIPIPAWLPAAPKSAAKNTGQANLLLSIIVTSLDSSSRASMPVEGEEAPLILIQIIKVSPFYLVFCFVFILKISLDARRPICFCY